jgi:hypothetical protein
VIILVHKLLSKVALFIALFVVKRTGNDYGDLVTASSYDELVFNFARALTKLVGFRLLKFAIKPFLPVVLWETTLLDSVQAFFILVLLFENVVICDELNSFIDSVGFDRLGEHIIVHCKTVLHTVHN